MLDRSIQSFHARLLYCVLFVAIFLVLDVASISVEFAGSDGSEYVSLSENYELDTDASIDESNTLDYGRLSLTQSRDAKMEGNNNLDQKVSGNNYQVNNNINNVGSLQTSGSFVANANSMELSQNMGGNGDVNFLLSGTQGQDEAVQEGSVSKGSITSTNSISTGNSVYISQSTELAGESGFVKGSASNSGNTATASVQVEGSLSSRLDTAAHGSVENRQTFHAEGSFIKANAYAREASVSSEFNVEVEDVGREAEEKTGGTLYSEAGSPQIASGDLSLQGDKVTFGTASSNGWGSYSSIQTRNDIISPMQKKQSVQSAEGDIVDSWEDSGSGTLGPLSRTIDVSTADGTKRITSTIEGEGCYSIEGSSAITANGANFYQQVSGDGSLQDSIEVESHSEPISAKGFTEIVDGKYSNIDIAKLNKDTNTVFVSQNSIGSLGDVQQKAEAKTEDGHSLTFASVDDSQNWNLRSSALANYNVVDGETYRRTRVNQDADVEGAQKLVGGAEAEYTEDSAYAIGSVNSALKSDMSLSAETVKSAVAEQEIESSGGDIRARTFSLMDEELIATDLIDLAKYLPDGMLESTINTMSKISIVASGTEFQAHMHSHSYPSIQHGLQLPFLGYNHFDEFVSNSAFGVVGGVLKYNGGTIPADYVYRATDARSWDQSPADFTSYSNSGMCQDRGSDDEPEQNVPWGIQAMYGVEAPYEDDRFSYTSGGQGIDIAVIDTGVDTLHPDLVFRVEDYYDIVDDHFEYANRNDNYKDEHGTHVAGILAADGGFDGKGLWGMAPEADLYTYQASHWDILKNDWTFSPNDEANAIYRATDLGTEIISLSLGNNHLLNPSGLWVDNAINYAKNNGVLMVASAGNDGPDGTITYPASKKEVIAVGALNSGQEVAEFKTSEGFKPPGGSAVSSKWVDDDIVDDGELELAAPGEDILSTVPTMNGWYDKLSGTSMAAPHISGLAAKYWSLDMSRTADDVRDKLHEMAARDSIITHENKEYSNDLNEYTGFGFPHLAGITYNEYWVPSIADVDTIYETDFELNGIGTLPPEFQILYSGKGTQYQVVTSSAAHSGSKSLQTWGRYNWGANINYYFSIPQSGRIGYEVWIKANPKEEGSAQFLNPEGAAWGWGWGGVSFDQNGNVNAPATAPNIHKEIQSAGDQWYKVNSEMDVETGETWIWLNDEIIADGITPVELGKTNPNAYKGIRAITFNDASWYENPSTPTYFDDFKFYIKTIEEGHYEYSIKKEEWDP